jgi:hypothetical protein
MELIRPFNQLGKADAGIAGGKGASLGEMTRAGIPVPPGFVILAGAFERFLEEADLNQELDAILHSVRRDEMGTVESASEKIRGLILNASMPEDIACEISKQFRTLDAEFVAVRSSATAEDSASASWAGQLDTYLNTTESDLLRNVQRCWASLFTPRAIFYRFEKGMHGSKISVAVVVQKMIQSEVAGIAFSVHPVTEDRNQLIIEAGFGLGEAIVSGQVTPDSYVIEKTPRRIIDKNVTIQNRALWRAADGGNEWRSLTDAGGGKPALRNDQALELAELVLKIEQHYGFPCDIEWAYEAEKFFITQSRPITTLSSKKSDFDAGEDTEIISTSGVVTKRKDSFLALGRWICPVLEYEVWMDWSNVDDAARFGIAPIDTSAIVLDGYYFVAARDAYTHIKTMAANEFRSGSFDVTNKLFGLAESRCDECIAVAHALPSKATFEDFRSAQKLQEQLRFPWNACIAIGEAGEEFVARYARENNLRIEEAAALIQDLPNSITLDQRELRSFKRHIDGKDLSYDILAIEKKDPEFAAKIRAYQRDTEYIGTHNFWGDGRTIARLMDSICDATSVGKQGGEIRNDIEGFKIIARATKARLECAQSASYLSYHCRPYLTRAAEEHELTYDEILSLTLEEMRMLIGGKSGFHSKIRERHQAYGIFKSGGELHVLTGKNLAIWQREFGFCKLMPP